MRVLILLTLLGTALAVPRNPQRIVGGTPTTVENYPYMSNMQYLVGGFFWLQWCGGSLINERSILSAAHCYIGDLPREWRVRLGTSQASSGGVVHDVAQLINHAGYSHNTIDNDIAIVRLATPAVFGNSIDTVAIGGANYNLPANTVVTTLGWGALFSDGPSPEQLQHVDINIVDQAICVARYAHLKTLPNFQGWPDITDNMICSGILDVGGKDACQGDSGGPLVHNGNVLVGIVSWGYSCADAEYPGVNARVSRYTNWIVANA